MSSNENSPDYGGPEPSWREAATILAVIVTLIWLLRLLLLYWDLPW